MCHKGVFETVQIDWTVRRPESPDIIVHGVWVEKCAACQEFVFPPESSDYIESVTAFEARGEVANPPKPKIFFDYEYGADSLAIKSAIRAVTTADGKLITPEGVDATLDELVKQASNGHKMIVIDSIDSLVS
jgi:hypothetical protein